MQPSDESLVRRIADRDPIAFETFLDRYRDALRRHLFGITRDEDTAEDLSQAAFLRLWTRTPRVHTGAKAWLFRVGTNLALNHIRTLRRRKERPLEIRPDFAEDEEEILVPPWLIDATTLGADAVAERIEQAEILWRLVDGLPEGKREVMRMVYGNEMDIQEAAEKLGVPKGTIKSRLHHARRQVAQKWEEMTKGLEEHG